MMIVSNPLVSVVVLTYNQEKTIHNTLDSILAQQTEYSFEIIIGEDASPYDNTRAICEYYANKYPDIITLMPKAPNKGLMRNYADCLAVCRGKYIAQCAGDDWWHNTNKLQIQIDFLENNKEYGVVHTDAKIYYPKLKKEITPKKKRNCPDGYILDTLYFVNFIYAASAIYKKDLLQYADFNKWIKLEFVAEDHSMWLAFSPYTLFKYLTVCTVTYTATENSISRPINIYEKIKFIEGICRIQLYFYEKYNTKKPALLKILSYQKKWIITVLLSAKEYKRLKNYGAPIYIRLSPSVYHKYLIAKRLLKNIITLLLKNKSSIYFI